jgi:hypothetical protein
MKKPLLMIVPLAVMTAISACNTTPLTTQLQPMALSYALNRARFDMNCPAATGQVLSSETVQPVLNGPLMMGNQRAQYTIGVSGCGQRQTMVVLCAQGGDGCFAANGNSGGTSYRQRASLSPPSR